MKLTKERCLKAAERLHSLKYGHKNKYPFVERKIDEKFSENAGVGRLVNDDRDVINQLINEHFDSSLTREKLEKALDKACEKLATVIDIEGCNAFCGKYAPNEKCACETKEFWKEYLLNED